MRTIRTFGDCVWLLGLGATVYTILHQEIIHHFYFRRERPSVFWNLEKNLTELIVSSSTNHTFYQIFGTLFTKFRIWLKV